jgi:lysophospholipid acyltransferase (LPLAT)-like uncharacterized protein
VIVSTPSSSRPAVAPRVEKPRILKWRHHLAAFALFVFLRALAWTWRVRLIDSGGHLKTIDGHVIFCTWHNRLAISMRAWQWFGRRLIRSAGLVCLISASHDGGMLARTLKYFGVEAVRGSSSRRGAQALLELTSWMEKNYSVAITPDGPRGPRYEIHDGIISLAQLSGRPILPVSTYVSWKVCLKSWDRFQIPLPFARCELRVGEPLSVPRDAPEEMRAAAKAELRKRLMSITQD